jgi:mannose-6-phosphate isomerase-like protein (cupin superfamily)
MRIVAMNHKVLLFIPVVLIFTFSSLFILAQTQLQVNETNDSPKYSIENCVNTFNPDNVEKTKVGFQYWFADKKFAEGKTVKLSVVQPHSGTHEPHSHIEDEFFFVLEGTATFYLDGKTKTVGEYTSLYCPSNVEHGIRNVGEKKLRYLVIKKYENVK